MKLHEYIKGLTDFVEENPEYADLEVYSARDPEGNGYYHCYWGPGARFSPDAGEHYIESVYSEEDEEYMLEMDDDYQQALWEFENEDGPEPLKPVYKPNIVIVAP